MPAIISSPSETNCAKCVSVLGAVCLKCSRCSSLLHLRCSDLSPYMLLRYKTSQSAYICRACVLSEGDPDSLKEAQDAIDQLLENEVKSIENAAKEADASIDELVSRNDPQDKTNKKSCHIDERNENQSIPNIGCIGKSCH